MQRNLKIAFLFLVLFGIVAIALLMWYSDQIIVLSPKGMIGHKQSDLLLISTYIMLLIVIPVFILTFVIFWKYRVGGKGAKYDPEFSHSYLAEALWWGIPLVIIVFLSVITYKSCHELDPFKPIDSDTKPLRIQVVALQWKWLFIYPEENIATVNFIQFPENTPLQFEITADAPMNSFWIPDLGGQIYAMAGMRSKLHLIANEQGTFRGSSANLSGSGFAGMYFTAKSSSHEEFENWVNSVKGSSSDLTLSKYEELVKPSSYNTAAYYNLAKVDLFNWIIDQYMSSEMENAQ